MNALNVLSKMSSEDNKTLKLAPLSNIRNANTWKDGLGIVEVVVDEATILNLLNKNLVGGFIVADREEFEIKEKQLQHEEDKKDGLIREYMKVINSMWDYFSMDKSRELGRDEKRIYEMVKKIKVEDCNCVAAEKSKGDE